MRQTLARAIASTLQAYRNCLDKPDTHSDWSEEHKRRLLDMARNLLPAGSGIDNGTKLDLELSTPERLILTFGYHHMNDNGMYAGWTEHTLTVMASLVFGLSLRISGRNRNDVKDYLYDTYDHALSSDVEWDNAANCYVFAQDKE